MAKSLDCGRHDVVITRRLSRWVGPGGPTHVRHRVIGGNRTAACACVVRSVLPVKCAHGEFRDEDDTARDRDNFADEPNECEREQDRDGQPDGAPDDEQRYRSRHINIQRPRSSLHNEQASATAAVQEALGYHARA